MGKEKLDIHLTKNEALVLFELLTRLNQKHLSGIFEDEAEQRVLWDLEANLQKQLVEPLQPDYLVILNKAREDVRDKE
jgi:hypothetical protein